MEYNPVIIRNCPCSNAALECIFLSVFNDNGIRCENIRDCPLQINRAQIFYPGVYPKRFQRRYAYIYYPLPTKKLKLESVIPDNKIKKQNKSNKDHNKPKQLYLI